MMIKLYKNTLALLILIVSHLLVSPFTQAYPEFIGYGYGSCITCHYNGLGNGALNDYGRGVWASEIAANIFSKTTKLEDLSARSGFLGSKELPYWIRPHIKYRGINVLPNPGGAGSKTKYYHMQIDAGAAIAIDQDQKYLIMLNYGYVPSPDPNMKNNLNRFLGRDLYLRVQATETIWLYLGKLEKAYGLRNVDHTSYNRVPQELFQNTQSHGAIIHYLGETSEFAINQFVGNMDSVNKTSEQKGTSFTSDIEVMEKGRIGLSALKSESELKNATTLVGAHWKQGLSTGTALLFEYGIIQKKDTTSATNGSYSYLQSMIRLAKGNHFITNIERYNRDISATTPDRWKVGLGFLFFPFQRMEFRFHATHQRDVSSESVTDDSWALQGQVHLAL